MLNEPEHNLRSSKHRPITELHRHMNTAQLLVIKLFSYVHYRHEHSMYSNLLLLQLKILLH